MRIYGLQKGVVTGLWRCLAAAALMTASLAHAQVQGITDAEIVVGTVAALTGPVALSGTTVRDGMILAIEEINATGGIHGRQIRLLVEDSGFDPKKAVLMTQKLLTQDKIFAMVSTYGSVMVQATAPLVLDRGVPMLFPIGGTDISYLPYHPLKFGLMTTSTQQIRAGVKYAYEKLGKRRFGILYQDDETGHGILRAAEDQLKVHGLTFIERTSYKRGEIKFSAQISRLKVANPDIVVLGTIIRETAAAEIEAKAQDWQVDMITPWATELVIPLGGQAVEGLYGTTQYLGRAQEMTPPFKAIVDRFTARFGHDFADTTSVGHGYTAMMLFAEGARKAGRNLTPQTLSKGLEQIRNFNTIFQIAPVSYGPGNHAPAPGVFVVQVKGGKWVPLLSAPVTY